ncbi:MAG: FtsX-like permease family protein [Bacteroidia bacterium]|nr:FtsX-like permease family protein [Bacteroidia bacterium]
MNWKWLIAKRFLTKEQQSKSRSVVLLAVLSVSASITVMNISMATLFGFQNEIERKVKRIQGDFIVDAGNNIENGEPNPIDNKLVSQFLDSLKTQPWRNQIEQIIPSTSKACVLKSKDEIEGVLVKTIPTNQLDQYLKGFTLSKSIITDTMPWIAVGSDLAKKLKLKLNDKLTVVFFVNDQNDTRPRARKLWVKRIYETGIDKIDQEIAFINPSILDPFVDSNFKYTQVEIWLPPNQESFQARKNILSILPAGDLRLNTLQEFNRVIFDWLAILETNVIIILTLMSLVAIATMSTTLLVLVIEKTSFVGLMRSMGARNTAIRMVFVYESLIIASGGLLIGNVISAIIIGLQNHYHWISLDQSVYFIKYVYMELSPLQYLGVNVGALVVIFLSLFIPSRYVSKINTIKAIQFK